MWFLYGSGHAALDDLAQEGSAAVPEGGWRDPTALLRLYARRAVAMVRQLAERMHGLVRIWGSVGYGSMESVREWVVRLRWVRWWRRARARPRRG